MSAYGALASKTAALPALPTTRWPVPAPSSSTSRHSASHLTLHHLTLARTPPALLQYLHAVFAAELARGATYPQELAPGETYTPAQFADYFFAGDVVLALTEPPHPQPHPESRAGSGSGSRSRGGVREEDGEETLFTEVRLVLEDAQRGRNWEECVAGFYYIKPNYPGRSSHICNGGFMVPPTQRGNKYASVLARSYLYYAPRLGYEASVFNLVYVNNAASVRLWESLNFTKAGRIPRAGRLRRADGAGDEFVDAWVFYKSFRAEDVAYEPGFDSGSSDGSLSPVS